MQDIRECVGDRLPAWSRTCPQCGYDLSGAAAAPIIVCSECGFPTTIQDLHTAHAVNRNGSPRSLSPHELIVPGARAAWGAMIIAAISAMLVILLARVL